MTINAVCVYCGAASPVEPLHGEAAEQFGTLLGEAGLALVYGGGQAGLMGAVADAALSAGSHVTGIIPRHLQVRERIHLGVQSMVVVDDMHARKREMIQRSDAFVVLPGGLGTLDESFEVLTWKRLGLHAKPVIIVNVAGYWTPLLTLLDHMIDAGFAHPFDRSNHVVVRDVAEAIARLTGDHPEPFPNALSVLDSRS